MSNIKILDCTLRDGGYVNEWKFSKRQVVDTIEGLIKSGVEIVECGFLDKNADNSKWSTRFSSLDVLNEFLSQFVKKQDQAFVAMINFGEFDVDLLPNSKQTKLDGLRLAFHRHKMSEALNDMKKIAQKGYKLFVQPMTTNAYSDEELKNLFEGLCNVNPYAVYIVDTQGSMYDIDIRRLFDVFSSNLDQSIYIGFHSHNNLQLSYANSIEFCNLGRLNQRNIIVDASIYGMGRGAGNLHTELFMEFLNERCRKTYSINEILSLIDRYYYALYKEFGWGYSIYHYLSASYECHPNYASFLFNKKHLLMQDIREVLTLIDTGKRNEFDQNYIDRLYYSYNAQKESKNSIPYFDKNKEVILIGSGKNSRQYIDNIPFTRKDCIVVSLNFIPENLDVDYTFFSSAKRYEFFSDKCTKEKTILVSNIAPKNQISFFLDYKRFSEINGSYHSDISVIMFINFLVFLKFKRVYLVGVDGFLENNENYIYNEMDRVVDKKVLENVNKEIKEYLSKISQKIDIVFLTESMFDVS